MTFIFITIIGVLAGVSTGIFGLGGSIVVLPTLYLLGFNLREAMGMSFFQMFFVIGISLYLRYRSYTIDFAMVRFTMPFVIAGAIAGIIISHMIPLRLLQMIFGAVLIALAVNMIRPKKKQEEAEFSASKKWMVALLALVTGLYSGIFGVGGTSIFTPGLTALGYGITNAISVSIFSVFGISGVGIVSYYYIWSQHFILSVLLCFGAVAGLFIGHRISLRDKTKKLTLYGLALLIILSGIIMLVRSLQG